MSTKLDVSLSYLYGLKPWWSTLYEKMNKVPYDEESIMSIINGELIYNSGYVLNNDVKSIAATLDFLGQKYIRSLEERLHRQLSDPNKSEIARVAVALEINTELKESYEFLSDNAIQSRARVATLIDPEEMSQWGLVDVPLLSILDEDLIPEAFGLEPGKSAETYFEELYQIDQKLDADQMEFDIQEEASDSPDIGEDSETDETESSSGESGESGESGSPNSESSSTGSSDSHAGSDPSNPDGDNSADFSDSQNGGSGSTGEGARPDSGAGGSAGQSGSQGSPDLASGELESNGEQSHSGSNPGDQGQDGVSKRPSTIKEQIAELMNNSDTAKWQCENVHESQDSQPDIKENIAQIAKDIASLNGRPGMAGMITKSMEKWSTKNLPRRKKDWSPVLRKAVSTAVSGAAMSGQSDMSYSKRNMNQSDEPGAPIMMGMMTYPPNALILVDSSPSMRAYKDSVLPEFINIVKKVTISRGAPCDIVAADAEISWAARGLSKARNDLSHIFNGKRGTTDLADVLMGIASKGVRWNNLNLAKPDIIIMLTDCKFDWPLPKHTRLPGRYCRVVVASTEPYDNLINQGYEMPKWLIPGKTFVYIDE